MNIQDLNLLRDGSAALVKKAQAEKGKLQHELDIIAKNVDAGGFSKQYAQEAEAKARQKYAPAIQALRAELHQHAEKATEARALWADKNYLLSRQRFVKGDDAQDAVVRNATAANMARLPLSALKLTVKQAIAEGSLATAFEAAAAAQTVYNERIPLDDVVIPQQKEALAAIDYVEHAAPGAVEIIESDVAGRRMDPVRKLQLAHAVAAKPVSLAA